MSSTEKQTNKQTNMQLFSTFRYENARSTVDTIFGQQFHPSFPSKLRPCQTTYGCGNYPATTGGLFRSGVDLLRGSQEQVTTEHSLIYTPPDINKALVPPSLPNFNKPLVPLSLPNLNKALVPPSLPNLNKALVSQNVHVYSHSCRLRLHFLVT